jgi:hypothetical protein
VRFLGFHGGKFKDGILLGYGVVYSPRSNLDTLFRVRTAVNKPAIKALVVKALHTSETSIYFYETTQRHIQEGYRLQNGICLYGI